jgi:hypothetical protein
MHNLSTAIVGLAVIVGACGREPANERVYRMARIK